MKRDVDVEATIVGKFVIMAPLLDERARRLWAAAESAAMGTAVTRSSLPRLGWRVRRSETDGESSCRAWRALDGFVVQARDVPTLRRPNRA